MSIEHKEVAVTGFDVVLGLFFGDNGPRQSLTLWILENSSRAVEVVFTNDPQPVLGYAPNPCAIVYLPLERYSRCCQVLRTNEPLKVHLVWDGDLLVQAWLGGEPVDPEEHVPELKFKFG